MKKYRCTLSYELEIEAKNQEEAREEFEEYVNQVDLSDMTEYKEIK